VKSSGIASLCLLLLTACATTTSAPPVDMGEPRRIVGTENSVRVDAQVTGEEAAAGSQVPITYEITNQRSTAIAIADLVPQTSYDEESRTLTVTIGSEVPGNELLPRLVLIGPGEKKTFAIAARMKYILPQRGSADPRVAAAPAELRLRVNFLGDVEPFRQLIGIKETAIADPKLADELFPAWLEKNEVLYTNSIPMRLLGRQQNPMMPGMEGVPPAPRRRRP
jgi:hypothetical protein